MKLYKETEDEYQHILFDLDGTLLPMVQDEFVRFYMPLLAKSYMEQGVSIDPKKFIGSVWAGYEAMVKNDGSRTNREAFWSYIDKDLPVPAKESERIALSFYGDAFNQAACTTSPTPVADQIVKAARARGTEDLSGHKSGVSPVRHSEPDPLGRTGRGGLQGDYDL